MNDDNLIILDNDIEVEKIINFKIVETIGICVCNINAIKNLDLRTWQEINKEIIKNGQNF